MQKLFLLTSTHHLFNGLYISGVFQQVLQGIAQVRRVDPGTAFPCIGMVKKSRPVSIWLENINDWLYNQVDVQLFSSRTCRFSRGGQFQDFVGLKL